MRPYIIIGVETYNFSGIDNETAQNILEASNHAFTFHFNCEVFGYEVPSEYYISTCNSIDIEKLTEFLNYAKSELIEGFPNLQPKFYVGS